MRAVYETLLERRKVAYTSVMTVMNILEQKGHLKKKRENRAYAYRPARPRAQVMRGMVLDFVDRVFQGAAKPLLVHLVEDERLSPEDLIESGAARFSSRSIGNSRRTTSDKMLAFRARMGRHAAVGKRNHWAAVETSGVTSSSLM